MCACVLSLELTARAPPSLLPARARRANFEPDVVFADPLNKFENLEAYLLNIAFLRVAFRPDFELHALAQTGPWEFQARWTMRLAMPSFGPMRSVWDPEVAFTGVSIYGIKPETGRVATHTDYWDSLPRDAQKFFSVQAARDFLGMAGSLERTPDLETPKYTLLKRAAEYEVRRYEPYEVASTPTGSGQLVGNAAAGMSFNALAGYIFSEAKQDMTTPVFTSPEAAEDTTAGVEMQFVVEDGTAEGGVAPSNPAVTTRRLDVGCVAARRFSGVVTDGDVARETKSLLAALDADGVAHAPEDKVFCAQYNEPSTPGPARRNEVLVPLIDFSLPEKWVE